MAAISLLSCSNNGKAQDIATETSNGASLANVAGIKYSETTLNKKEGKRVLVISSSPRKGGNTDLLCDAFVKGAMEAGGDVEKVSLADYNLNFINEETANTFHRTASDSISDNGLLVDKFLAADVVVLSSPTYYMNISDRMKTFIDATAIAFGDKRMEGKEYYYITACADRSEETSEWCFNGFRGFVMCIPQSVERGYVRAIGMGQPGAVKDTEFEKQAYELGKTINK